jgi:hypothetical protein
MSARDILKKIIGYEESNLKILIKKLIYGNVPHEDKNAALINTVKAKRYAVSLFTDLTAPDIIKEYAILSAENTLIYTEEIL